MGLLTGYYREQRDAQTHAVAPYGHVLDKLPSYLQQLEMESNGKSVRRDGSPVTTPTGEVVWGTAGRNGRSTRTSSCCTRAQCSCRSTSSASPARSPVSMSKATRTCSSLRELAGAVRGARVRDGRPVAAAVPGDARQPTVEHLLRRPAHAVRIGALVAAYEHKVMTLGVLWDIDSFDQWGVELEEARDPHSRSESSRPTNPSSRTTTRRTRASGSTVLVVRSELFVVLVGGGTTGVARGAVGFAVSSVSTTS